MDYSSSHFTYFFDDIICAHSFNDYIETSDSYLYIFSSELYFNPVFMNVFRKKKNLGNDLKAPQIHQIELDISMDAQMALLIHQKFIHLETIF